MSSEAENGKNSSSEADKKENDVNVETKIQEEKEVKIEKEVDNKNEEKTADIKPEKSPTSEDKVDKQHNDIKKDKEKDNECENEKEEKNEKKSNNDSNDTEEGEGSNKEDSENDDKSVPLLDQPLEQSGTRERKKVQRYNEDLPLEAKEGKAEIPNGSGIQLGEIPRIDASISRFKNDDLKLLHRLLFKTPGKTALIKKNIKKFNGFDFKKDSEEYTKKMAAVQKFEVKQLKSICEMLDLEKKGNKEEISERIIDFLIEPKDSGKIVGGGRPKRTAAVKANNRGYSSHDDSYSSDERQATRSRRDKGKRTNLKEESSSGSDEDFHPSDEEERPRVAKGKRGRKRAQSEEDISDVEESASSDDSDEEPKKKKRGNAKVVNNKNKGKSTPKTRGRKPAAKKKTPLKRGRKRDNESSEEESDHPEQEEEDEGSSSEDEPLAKKTKASQPPTDEEIKTYVKEILDGANLEEITMKTVCKQVYAHYPDFDLAHKKDFIKSTVKSLIST